MASTDAGTAEAAAPRILLPVLACGNFVAVASAWLIVGLLPLVRTDLGLDDVGAASLVSVFTLTYALTSPFLGLLAVRLGYRLTLALAMSLVTLTAIATALAPGYGTLIGARIFAALGSAAFTPVAAALAVARSAPGRQGVALAVIYIGIPMSQILGIPLGTTLGFAFGWHGAFYAVAALSLTQLALIFVTVPGTGRPPRPAPGAMAEGLSRPGMLPTLAVAVLCSCTANIFYTFVADILVDRAALSGAGISMGLTCLGLGTLFGTFLVGRLLDIVGPRRILLASFAIGALALPFTTLTRYGMPLAYLWMILLGATLFTHIPALQSRITTLAPGLAGLLFGLISSMVYVGASLGSFTGGLVAKHLGLIWLGPASTTVAVVLLAVILGDRRWSPANRAS
ncbi:MFS transporter [Tropicimonas isoalkanivorans]|uniref:Predicted arabinose efflux permease, MFS family n=1 Tax=Tropicimonas isoalkanivorans TaxID=441112 RepID=A0A1I1HW88_9RHOB|nr:MFS transporter [Tropicimonas isoalkanivorans]SFC28156.1 Predicted arabinose efflux permease, MFS family [Tropicimonas isoalkanivorans]